MFLDAVIPEALDLDEVEVDQPKLAELTVAKIAPITEKMRHLLAERQEIDAILVKGAETARSVAAPVVAEVKDIMGFWKV